VLPPGLALDPGDPGGCTAFFVDWQYASTSGEELTDPVRSQDHEFLVLVNAVYEGWRQVWSNNPPRSASTARSAAAPTSWGSFPTAPPRSG
jgi:hypothetical protein